MNLFGDMNLEYLSKALDASVLRNNVIANNIANVNTPNYLAQGVSFEEMMKECIAKDQNGFQQASYDGGANALLNNLAGVQPTVYSTGNKVDINKEMSELAKNQIWYNAIVSQGIGKMFSRLNTVLSMFQG